MPGNCLGCVAVIPTLMHQQCLKHAVFKERNTEQEDIT